MAEELTITFQGGYITALKQDGKPHFLPRNKIVKVGDYTIMCDTFAEAIALCDLTGQSPEIETKLAPVPEEYARRRKNGNGARRGPPRGAPRQRRERAPR